MLLFQQLEPEKWSEEREGILNVEHECFSKEDETDEEVFDDVSKGTPQILLVKDDGKTVGYIMWANEDYADVKDGGFDNVYVFSIAVLPEYRGRGVATKLINLLIIKYKGKMRKISLHTKYGSFKKLCIKQGFRSVRKERLDDDKEDKWYLVKKL